MRTLWLLEVRGPLGRLDFVLLALRALRPRLTDGLDALDTLDTLDALDTPEPSKTSDGVKNVTDERTNRQGDSKSRI